jgi:glycosyltransferase involved in cell wall biosynthesis
MAVRKPPIAHLLPFSGVGGTEVGTLRLAQAAREEGFESIAFCLPGAGETRELFASAGFSTGVYPDHYLSVRHFGNWWRNTRRFAAKLRECGAGLVHCSDLRAASIAAVSGRLAGLPVLCQVRSRQESLPLRDRLPLYAVDRFVFVSQASWRAFFLRVPPERGTVLYDGIQAQPVDAAPARARALEEFRLPPSAFLIGMVSRVSPFKGFRTLVDAAAEVVAQRPEAHFLIVGEYSSPPSYKRHYEEIQGWLAERGLEAHFTFTGFRDDVPRLLAALDLFVLSTQSEGFPLVILEAMAQGKGVVATAVDGIPEIVEDGSSGLLHALGDAPGLARQILRFMSDAALREKLTAAGRALVATRFSREEYRRSVGALYRSFLG